MLLLSSNDGFQNKKKGGVLGFKYEILAPAYFSLILYNDKDFCLQTNGSSSFRNLDDLVIETRTKRGEEISFAIQLKHRKNDNKTISLDFITKGKLSLEQYCFSFKKMPKEHQKYNFIIYTNAIFNRAIMNEVEEFKMSEREGEFIFNISADKRNVYKFELTANSPESDKVNREDYEKFLLRLSLFVCQKNVRKFREEIENFLKKDVSNKDVWLKYVHLFRLWRHKEFTNNCINKAVVNYHLMDEFLWPYVIRNYHFSKEGGLQLFKDAIREFDVTVIKGSMSLQANLKKKSHFGLDLCIKNWPKY